MNKALKHILFVMPRPLTILFTLLISVFALDMFSMNLSFLDMVVGLFMHLIPSIVMGIALILAWRWEWVGTVFYTLVGRWFLYVSTPGDVIYYIVIVGLPFLIAGLFLVGWVKLGEVRE